MPTGPTKSDPTHDADATTARSPSSAGEPSASGDNNSSKKTDSASGKEKHGFMDKIKGEMKVISGKLGHDEEKVELGKQMMGKN
ncbi:hypothetical protein BDQ17DRAFT_1379990 [Cyathus striatus]|nr:hypothetical protein BDQ17DRAFT_1379990 [Cyathus striatus]